MLSARKKEENKYLETLDFEVFDPIEDIINAGMKNATITMIGKRRSGKSIFIRDILYQIHKYYEQVYLFSGTYEVQNEFWDWIPRENIFNGLDEEAANMIWQRQKKMIAKAQSEALREGKKLDRSKLPHVMLIFDDIIQTTSGVRHSDFLAKLYSNGRHMCICSILATQSYKTVSKHVRDNSDFSIAYKFKNGDDKSDFAQENFVTSSGYLREGIMDKITANDDFYCAVVINHLNSINITKTIKKYKARFDVPKFTTGKDATGGVEYVGGENAGGTEMPLLTKLGNLPNRSNKLVKMSLKNKILKTLNAGIKTVRALEIENFEE